RPRGALRGQRRRPEVTVPSATAAVRAGDDLEEVPVVAQEVHAAPAVVAVELARLALPGVGPVLHAALDDPPVDLVELRLADQERVVLSGDLVARRGEVEPDAVGGVDLPEVPETARRGQAEQLGEPVRRGVRVAGGDDRVVELDGHRLHLAVLSRRWRGTGQWVSTFELHSGSYRSTSSWRTSHASLHRRRARHPTPA